MSTPPAVDHAVVPPLFAELIDDAAVFPPGSSPLPEAVETHLARTTSPYAGCVGPLLVPAAAASDLVEVAAGREIRVGIVARPGVPVALVREAVATLDGTGARVTGVEVGWSPSWRDVAALGLPVSVEIPRDVHDAAIADVAGAAQTGPKRVQAKFRTGATDAWAWPDEHELARFVRACVDAGLAFKLTGGLHHAVRGDHGSRTGADPQHGVLNVLAAVRSSLDGAPVDALASLLAERDPAVIASTIGRTSDAEATSVRSVFTAYGCCTVTDPLGELAALGLLACSTGP